MIGRSWTDETSAAVGLFGAVFGVMCALFSPVFGLTVMEAMRGATERGVPWPLAAAAGLLIASTIGLPAFGIGWAARRYAREERARALRRAAVARNTGLGASGMSLLVAVIFLLVS